MNHSFSLKGVSRYDGALPCFTVGCIHCDLATGWGPHHFHRDVTWYLNQTFPQRRTDCGCYNPSPPRSPDLTLMDFPFWEIHYRIVNIMALVDVTFLYKLWDELEYRADVCSITRCSHTEHVKKLEVLTNAL
jgi:hypothetical protein